MTSRRRSTMQRAAALVALAALVAATGCSITRPSPVKESFLLEPTLPAAAAKPQSGSLRVGTTNVAAPFRPRGFVIRTSDLQYEADFYREFFVPPGVMIADATARALAAARVFAHVARPGVSVDADWVLDAFVGALYADMRDAANPLAVIQITYYLSRDDGGITAPVWSKGYRRQVAFPPSNSGAYVTSLNAAFGEIVAGLASDLAAAQLPAK
jgi:cholesterol transport system auxiliary component